MKKIIKQTVFLLAMAITVAGCDSSEMNKQTSLKGTKWKLAGIVDAETGEMKVLEPKNCEDCYTLTFITNTIAEMFLEEYAGFRERCELNLSKLGEYMIDSRMRPDEGYILVLSLYSHNTKSYSISSNELKFINDIDNYYLLFKKIEP